MDLTTLYDVSKLVGFCDEENSQNKFPHLRRATTPDSSQWCLWENEQQVVEWWDIHRWLHLDIHVHSEAQARGVPPIKAMVEKSLGYQLKVHVLRTDNSGEYTSNEFQEYLQQKGISHELKVPKPQSKMGRQKRWIELLLKQNDWCWTERDCHSASGRRRCQQLFTCRIVAQLRQWRKQHPLKHGLVKNHV